jgi:NAD(P)-dependent dehydrogenase (short-subunit alcohol dehydrogenase family)
MMRSSAGVLQGRHAVVTGGGRGIGTAIASALAAEGANLTLMSRTAATLEQHAESLQRTYGVRAHALVVDVGNPPDVRRAFVEAVAQAGPVHILINNAGQSDAASFPDISLDMWDRMIAVISPGHFSACSRCCQR